MAEAFYARLFSAAPRLRSMFPEDLSAQARKLTDALDAVVRNLESAELNASMIAELGRRHAAYGAKPEHYDLVIDCFLVTMRGLLGAGADQTVLDDWRTALRLISDRMIEAASTQASEDRSKLRASSSPPGSPARR